MTDLDELQHKIDQIKSESDEGKQATPSAAYGNAMRYGTELFAGAGVGGVLGYFIDRVAGTSPIFFILFFFIGFAAGVRNIIRNVSKVEE